MANPDSAQSKKKTLCPICGGTIRRGSLTAWIFGGDPDQCLCQLKSTEVPGSSAHQEQLMAFAVKDQAAIGAVGDRIAGRYQLLKLVGQGANGSVYKAYDEQFDGQVAIKILRPTLLKDASAVKRFERESETARGLSHHNLVVVHDYGVADNQLPYIVMDFLEGKSLAQIIETEGPLEPQRAIRIFIQGCQAVAHAHSKGVVHRDLKPSNVVILTNPDGSDLVKIVDFGIAKLNPEATAAEGALTQTGEIFGSPLYMSPEQCSGRKLDKRSDLYSFGCLMFEALTGMPPFQGVNPIQIILKHINNDPNDVFDQYKHLKISDSLQSVVLRCLAKNPADRYQSAEALERDLMGVRIGQVIKRPKKRDTPLTVPSLPVPALIIAVVVVAIGGIYLVSKTPSNTTGKLSARDQWSQLDREGQRNMDGGDYPTALKDYQDELGIADGSMKSLVLASLNELLDLYTAWGKESDADSIKERIQKERARMDDRHRQVESDLDQLDQELSGASNNQMQERSASILSNAVNSAADMRESGGFENADRILRKCCRLAPEAVGAQSPILISSLHNRALNYHKQGRYEMALPLYMQALRLEEKALSANDPLYASTLLELGHLGSDSDLVPQKQAEAYLLCALDIYRKTLGGEDEKVGRTRLYLAKLYSKVGREEDAKREAKAAFSIYQALPEPNPMDEARCYAVLGVVENNTSELERALSILEDSSQKDYSSLLTTLEALSANLKSTQKERAASLLKRAAAIRCRFAGATQTGDAAGSGLKPAK